MRNFLLRLFGPIMMFITLRYDTEHPNYEVADLNVEGFLFWVASIFLGMIITMFSLDWHICGPQISLSDKLHVLFWASLIVAFSLYLGLLLRKLNEAVMREVKPYIDAAFSFCDKVIEKL